MAPQAQRLDEQPSFYLSYAPADYCEILQEFFVDLRATVARHLGLSRTNQRVGFLDSATSINSAEFTADAVAALRTSKTMVALTSPEFFRSERAAREWQIFKLREKVRGHNGSSESPSSIIPITWLPSDNAVWDTEQQGIGQSIGPYQKTGLHDFYMRIHADQSEREYAEFLVELTEHIVSASKAVLPPVDVSSMERLDNPFGPFRTVIVANPQRDRAALEEFLTQEGFQVFAYDAPADVPAQYLISDPALDAIDLFVIDLGNTAPDEPPPRKIDLGYEESEALALIAKQIDLGYEESEALALIEKIKRIHTRPARLAMSAHMTNEKALTAMTKGAEDVVSTVDTGYKELVRIMRNLAGIGRSRRFYSQGFSQTQKKRKRPVFLSYSSRDNDNQNVAIFLKSRMEAIGIGVWYFEENQSPNNSEAARHAFAGVADAEIFLPLITPDYSLSTPCLAEFISCLQHPERNRILMPVLHGSIHEIKNFDWIEHLLKPHWKLSRDRFFDDLTRLMGDIQEAIGRRNGSIPAAGLDFDAVGIVAENSPQESHN